MNRSIASGVLSVVSAKVVVLLVGVVTTPILFRLLEPAGFGEYSFLMSVFSLYMIFVSSGVTDGVRKFLAEDRSMADWQVHVVGYYLRLASLFSLVGAVVLVLAATSGVVAALFGPAYAPFFYVLAILVVSVQSKATARKTLMGFGLERYSEPLNVLERVAFVGVALTLVAAGYGVYGALAGHAVASVLVGVIGFALIHRRVSLSSVLRSTPPEFPRVQMLTFNSMSVVLLLFLSSLYHIDIVMVQHFRESAAVGTYRAALTLAEFLWFIPLALQTVYVHSTSELWSNRRTEAITDLASRTTRLTLLLTAVMAVGLAALADVVVPIYFGPEATPAITPLVLLLPGALGFALARPILAISQGNGRLRYPVAATATAAVLNVVLNAALIPRFGTAGAAVATSVGYGSMFVFHCLSARSIGFDPLADARLGRVTGATLLAAVPVFALAGAISDPWLALVLVPPFGLAVYLALAVIVGALDPAEPFEVLAVVPGSIGSRAESIRQQLNKPAGGRPVRRWYHRVLFAAGLTLLISGGVLALFGPGFGIGAP